MNWHSIKTQRFSLFLCVCVWLAAAISTHLPAERIPKTGYSDKTLHAVGYAFIAGTFLLAMWSREVGRKKRFLLAFIILLVYAAVDEITQPLVNRYASIFDWLADTVGVGLALLADLGLGWIKHTLHRPKPDNAG